MVTFHIQESLFCFINWMLPIFLELFPQPWLSRTMLWLKHNFPNKYKQQTFLPKEISSGDFFNQSFTKTRVDIILLCFDIIKPSSLDALLIKSSASSNLFCGKNNLHLNNLLALNHPRQDPETSDRLQVRPGDPHGLRVRVEAESAPRRPETRSCPLCWDRGCKVSQLLQSYIRGEHRQSPYLVGNV